MGAGFLFTVLQNSLYRSSLYQGLSVFQNFLYIYFMQGDVFCFSNLDEALFETDFVIEAINEELEDKKHLLEREYNYFWICFLKKKLPTHKIHISFVIGVSKICKPSVIIASSSLKLSLDDVFESSVFKEVNILEVIIALISTN